MKSLYAAEAVAKGHPDKACDQVSDALLDAYLYQDSQARVDITCVLSHDTLFLAGEITSSATVDVVNVAKKVLRDIGYTNKEKGFDVATCKTHVELCQQSSDIAQAVQHGAGDQGIMIGYATDETDEYMPIASVLTHKLVESLEELSHFGPDGKTAIGVVYENNAPSYISYIILSYQHASSMPLEEVKSTLQTHIVQTLPPKLISSDTKIFTNPGGRFVLGGPSADTGLTGRKLMVDTYGSAASHGGGAFSGKDPTKVDRSGAYMARYVAKNIVAAGIAKRCEVSLHFAIGTPNPVALGINTFGTSKYDNALLEKAILQVFDLSVAGIISTLNLQSPIYQKTASHGHFGHNSFSWEQVNKVHPLLESLTHI